MRRNGVEVAVFGDADDLARAASDSFVRFAAGSIRASGRFVVALSGGSTPKRLYALLATPRCAARVDWDRVHVCWCDERCVPPDDPDSNYGLAREILLAHVPVREDHVHRIRGEDDPVASAARYEHELRKLFGTPNGRPRAASGARFDLVLLGMGVDGHTASLFPGSAAVRERESWVLAQPAPGLRTWRVTLTPVVLDAAAEVLVLVSGSDKAATLSRVLDGPRDPDVLPAQILAPADGRLRWLVDQAAAGQLRKGE